MTEWSRPSLLAALRQLSETHDVLLTVAPRPDVLSGRWWSLEWTAPDGQQRVVTAQRSDLLLERAAERVKQDEGVEG
ncbi:MAG: hypothetical protein ACRDI2_23795 [Chloroflexota bacterium]